MFDREHCGCSDPGCSCCSGECHRVADSILYRVDMDDATGTPMCEGCARDATDSGLFRREEIGDGGNLGAREIEIDGEVYEIDDVRELGWGHGGHFITSGRLEWNVFPSSEDAGKAARAYWEEMVRTDPAEFRCLVGDETLVAWALGESAGPGSVAVSSLDEWLDLTAGHPEEQWAGYDGSEIRACGSARRSRTNWDTRRASRTGTTERSKEPVVGPGHVASALLFSEESSCPTSAAWTVIGVTYAVVMRRRRARSPAGWRRSTGDWRS